MSANGPGAPEAAPGPRRRRQAAPVLPEGPVRASANVCQAAGCLSMGSDRVFEVLGEQVVARGLTDIAVRRVGCLGLCAAGPLVAVPEQGRIFDYVALEGPDGVDRVLGALAPAAAPTRGLRAGGRSQRTPSFPTR